MKINHENISHDWPNHFVHNLEQAIEFHSHNKHDTHGISNAAILCLSEVRDAFEKAINGKRLPTINP